MALGVAANIIGTPCGISKARLEFETLGAPDAFSVGPGTPFSIVHLALYVQLPLFGELDKVGVTARGSDGFDAKDLRKFSSDLHACCKGAGCAELQGYVDCFALRVDSNNDGTARLSGRLKAPVGDDSEWDCFSQFALESGAMEGPFRLDFAFATNAAALLEFLPQLAELLGCCSPLE